MRVGRFALGPVGADQTAAAQFAMQETPMPKAITLEMLHAMSPDQRKTLHGNASGLDTPAARAVLELLAQDNLMPAPKVAKAPAKAPAARKAPARKADARAVPAKPRAAKAAAKPRSAVHGRQA